MSGDARSALVAPGRAAAHGLVATPCHVRAQAGIGGHSRLSVSTTPRPTLCAMVCAMPGPPQGVFRAAPAMLMPPFQTRNVPHPSPGFGSA